MLNNSQRVVLNTSFLYGKMIISMVIALYSTRLILDALGAVDYGIYNLIAGVVAMLSFLNASMTVSSQRYMSYYLGSGENRKKEQVFKSSIILHLVIGVLIVIVLEIAGLFLFDGFLNIPESRISTAKAVFHFMVVSMFFTINAVPYDASINAHENMFFDALTGILESILKLVIAIWVTFYQSDKLILFGLSMAALTILIRIIKSVYCSINYEECRIDRSMKVDKQLLREMFSFAGWNMFGAMAGMARGQGIAIVLNLFHGAVINASYGIANQVANQLRSLSTMMFKAVNPQIMKSEGADDRLKMLRLSMISSKFSFLLMLMFAVPIIYEMKALLHIWLKEVPEYTIAFSQLIVLGVLINQLTIGLQSAIQATGKIVAYQATVGSIIILNVPIAYILLKYNFPPSSVLISFCVVELVACGFRLFFIKRETSLFIKDYFFRVIAREFIPTILLIISCSFITTYFHFEYRFVLTGIFSVLVLSIGSYLFGLCANERKIINELISTVIKKSK